MKGKRLLLTLFFAVFCCGLFWEGYLKQRVIQSLIGLLDEEAATSCGGTIQYDSASLSLFTLNAEARNVRLVIDGQTHLRVQRLHARFSLRDILSQVVHLTNLDMIGTHADGISDESGTFRFIDHLTAPLPPEKDVPGRWKVILQELAVIDGSFVEQFRSSELHAHGVSLQVVRQPDDTFLLTPDISQLDVRYPRPSLDRTFRLGGLHSEISITSAKTLFNTISLVNQQASVMLSAVAERDKDLTLSGSGALTLVAESLDISPPLVGTVMGTTTVSGPLASPRLDGKLHATPPLTIAPGGVPVLVFDELTGGFSVDVNRGNPIVSLSDVTGRGTGAAASKGRFTLVENRMEGSVTLHLDHILSDVVSAHDANLDISLSGTIDRPIVTLSLIANSGQFLWYDVGPITAQGDLTDGILSFTVKPTRSTLEGKGAIDLTREGDPELVGLHLSAKEIRIKDLRAPSVVDDLVFDGTISLSGPLSASALQGKGTFDVSYQPLSGKWPMPHILKGALTLKGGILSFTGSDETGQLLAEGSVVIDDQSPSSLKITSSSFTPPVAPAEQVCLNFSATTLYTFSIEKPLQGDGTITLQGFQVGCPPYNLTIAGPTAVPIKSGRAQLAPFALAGKGSTIGFQGWASLAEGYATTASGGIRVESLLELLPAVDNASGRIEGKVAITGPIHAPAFNGTISLHEGRVAALQAGFEGQSIEGQGDLSGHRIMITSLTGILNEGSVSARGVIDVEQPQSSLITATLSGVRYDGIANLSTEGDGEVTLSWSPTLIPQIGGTVQLQSASFEQSIDLAAVAKVISQAVLGMRQLNQVTAVPQEGPVEFHLSVQGDHDLFLVTNWAEAELKANLTIGGTPAAPVFSGELEALNGWFGFKDSKFTLVSGTIRFKPEEGVPLIDILGQASVISGSGESNTIILEARGPADNPKIVLSSDRGLSQRDIIALLTGGGGRSDLTRQASVSRFGIALSYQDVSLWDQDSPVLGSTMISRLTHIDTLSIEPAYNNTTGSIDPAVIATKRLSDRISLVGEGLFGGTVSESRARMDYQIADSLNVTGTIESSSLRQGTQLGLDVALTIKSKERVPLAISFIGNDTYEDSQVISFSKIKRTRPLRSAQLRSVARRILAGYHDRGYRSATVNTRCKDSGEPCSNLEVIIEEGPLHHVERVRLEGPNLETLIPQDLIQQLMRRTYATKAFQQQAQKMVTRYLREQGYLASRVEAEYLPSPDTSDSQDLILHIDPGLHHTFVFTGNSRFTAETLLDTMDLLDRTLPFGNNSITVLLEKIEERYRRAGYLYATVSFQKETSKPPHDILYRIHVNEESEVHVEEVTFRGVNAVPIHDLKRRLRAQELTTRGLTILRPTYAIDEEIQSNARIMEGIYRSLGYTNATVSYEITPKEEQGVIIQYVVDEGNRNLVSIGSIEGLPLHVTSPKIPEGSISPLVANDVIEELAETLRNAGYHFATIALRLDAPDKPLVIVVTPGSPVRIAHIVVEGNVTVPSHTIHHALGLQEGQSWDTPQLEQGRREILKLGLFSSVVFSETPTTDPTARTLTVKVVERPLSFLRMGGGANSQFGMHVFGEASDRSFFLDGRALSFRADLYVLPGTLDVTQGIASMLFSTPSVFDSPYTFVEDLRFQKLSTTTQEFDVERNIISSYLYRSGSTGVGFTLGHSFTRETITDVPADVRLSNLDSGVVLLSTLNTSMTLDRRDAPLMPTSGYTLGLDTSLASNAIGSNASYLSGTVRASTVVPLFSRVSDWSLAANTRWGASWAYGGTEEIPITQRYYLGGRNSIRGFRENSLGPRGTLGNVIGGDLLSASSFQLQYRIAERISLHTFLDIGNVFLRSQNPSLSNQRKGYGVGIRFLSPIGPVGCDLGFPVDPQDGEPQMRFHFSVGSNY